MHIHVCVYLHVYVHVCIICSFVFSCGCRHGPNGTAICVYHAESSGPSKGGTILDAQNRGILDVFDLNKFEDESREANKDGENFLDVCN